MLTEKAEGRIAMLIVDKLAFQEKLSEGEKRWPPIFWRMGWKLPNIPPQSGRSDLHLSADRPAPLQKAGFYRL